MNRNYSTVHLDDAIDFWSDAHKNDPELQLIEAELDKLCELVPVITISDGAGIVFDTIICVNVKIGDLDELLVASLPVYPKHTSETQVEKFIETWQAVAKRNGFYCKINLDTTEIFETALERLERLKRK